MIREVRVTPVYDWLEASKARINVLRGGTRSSKTHSMAQHFIFNKLIEGEDRVIIIARKTLPALKKTAKKLFIDLLDEYGVPYRENKTDLELRHKNNLVYFMSLDDPGKAGSLDFNDIWLEEANEFTWDDFKQFNIRASRKGGGNQLYLTFNPISALHWIKTDLVDKRDDVAENVSTYKDNIRNLPPELVKEIEDLAKQDPDFKRVFAEGQWGALEGLIYSRWKTTDEPASIDDVSYGVDWGFNNPASLVKVYWVDGRVIWQEMLYETGLTHQQFSELVAESIIRDGNKNKELYVDSAEPELIKVMAGKGLNAHKAKKDVVAGINCCKSLLIGVTKDSPNLIKELQSYKWKQDREGRTIDEPLKFNDHALDAGRYGTFSKVTNYGKAKTLAISFR